MGDMILDVFIPFKTPLDSKFDNFIQPEQLFHVDHVFQTAEPYKLGLVVDLTKSKRFYNRREITDSNCKYLKIECKGNEERPTPEQVDLFIKVVNQFLDNNPGEQKVGVHCTHGFNRTGFLIVAYLVEELNYGVEIAVQIFADARPPGIYKSDYLQELFERYGSSEDCPPAPPLPDWCVGTPKFMEGVLRVATLDQDSVEAHEARELADRLCKIGAFVYSDGQLVFADGQSSNSESESSVPPNSDRLEETNKRSKHPLRFRGSQPVSISVRNMESLVNYDYCVSYKADGCRYFLLISGPNKVYLIDRANFVYKPDVLHFPTVSWVKNMQQSGNQIQSTSAFLTCPDGHLFNTLLDGEMVMCHDPSKSEAYMHENAANGTPRFLIYDAVTVNGQPIGRTPFFERYAAIDKQIIWPRNTAGHMGLVDFSAQSFSIRRKPFRPLNQTEELLKPEFAQHLDHITDGLIFQPCGPDEFYILGTCPQTLKWKPPHLNTIDFRCKIVHESKVGEIPGYVGQLYLGGLNVPSARLAHVGPKDKHLDGKIVECSLVPGVGWRVLRIRTDKTEPNYHKSGVGWNPHLELRIPLTTYQKAWGSGVQKLVLCYTWNPQTVVTPGNSMDNVSQKKALFNPIANTAGVRIHSPHKGYKFGRDTSDRQITPKFLTVNGVKSSFQIKENDQRGSLKEWRRSRICRT
ncbi:mRNA-capping enzyme [Clonorchis sinensis]|uniref:mRNA-capping enzyme n=1 Tax=Clonorchis sinensis TaxID=79923 RepID=H2KVF1_CLOSI|nr:mRNA-capping enzyme [Clonorchis sinensis]